MERLFKHRHTSEELQKTCDSLLVDLSASEQVDVTHLSPAIQFSCLGNSNRNQFTSVYSFRRFPGLFLMKNVLPKDLQKTIVKESLVEYARPPNLTNLDAHFVLPASGIWNEYSKHIPNQTLRRRDLNHSSIEKAELSDSAGSLVIDAPTDPMSSPNKDELLSKLMNRLRWVTLGFQYNWTLKEYYMDRSPTFPPLIQDITNDVIGFMQQLTEYPLEKWRPEAGIINFYHPGDSLIAHQDRSEINKTSPLLSFSIGMDGILLFGTETRDDEPMAIRLESGDVLIMHNEARLAFHGLPTTIPGTTPSYLLENSDDWRGFSDFMRQSRINLNVRQVF